MIVEAGGRRVATVQERAKGLLLEERPNGQEIVLGRLYLGHLGDHLCASPLPRLLNGVHGMRVYVEDSQINRAIYLHNPYVSGFRTAGGIVLDKYVSGRPGHLVHRLQRGFGLEPRGVPRPEVYLSAEEWRWGVRERAKWPGGRPVCILSARSISEQHNYCGVDWDLVGRTWMRSCTVVQPIISRQSVYQSAIAGLPSEFVWQRETTVPGAVVYENLSTREYMSLIAVADYYCGAIAGGSHVAAALEVPSLVVLWGELLNELRFPCGKLENKVLWLYPQHCFIAADDPCGTRGGYAGLDEVVEQMLSHGEALPNRIGDLPGICLVRAPQPRKSLLRTKAGRVVAVPVVMRD